MEEQYIKALRILGMDSFSSQFDYETGVKLLPVLGEYLIREDILKTARLLMCPFLIKDFSGYNTLRAVRQARSFNILLDDFLNSIYFIFRRQSTFVESWHKALMQEEIRWLYKEG